MGCKDKLPGAAGRAAGAAAGGADAGLGIARPGEAGVNGRVKPAGAVGVAAGAAG